jgi:hypothetical protein
MEHTFHPLFTNQILNEEEKITGYNNLKILISLTPKLITPHIRIYYEKTNSIKDDLEHLLKSHYEELYCTESSSFLSKLKEETKNASVAPKGEIIKNKENFEVIN